MAQGQSLDDLNELEKPGASVRWVNQWDNLDGSIERGYADRSIFFQNRKVRDDMTRASEYARLLASVGINGCNVSNVNADLHILDPDFIAQLNRSQPIANKQPGDDRAVVMFVQMGPQEFLIAGRGAIVSFTPDAEGTVGIVSVDEEVLVDGKWVWQRRLNGDEWAGPGGESKSGAKT